MANETVVLRDLPFWATKGTLEAWLSALRITSNSANPFPKFVIASFKKGKPLNKHKNRPSIPAWAIILCKRPTSLAAAISTSSHSEEWPSLPGSAFTGAVSQRPTVEYAPHQAKATASNRPAKGDTGCGSIFVDESYLRFVANLITAPNSSRPFITFKVGIRGSDEEKIVGTLGCDCEEAWQDGVDKEFVNDKLSLLGSSFHTEYSDIQSDAKQGSLVTDLRPSEEFVLSNTQSWQSFPPSPRQTCPQFQYFPYFQPCHHLLQVSGQPVLCPQSPHQPVQMGPHGFVEWAMRTQLHGLVQSGPSQPQTYFLGFGKQNNVGFQYW
eukprot:GILI01028039.1.p1 GENE.GILI01028039.1~~GILI01028039.1.p1  ORF type:complete len:348 (+),score=22.04 GILI01028039.1:74-1045(+)